MSVAVVAMAAALLALASCSGDSPAPVDADEAGKLRIDFRVASPSAARSSRADAGNTDEFVDGVGAESAIDITGGSYRVYFFEDDDAEGGKFIAEWSRVSEMHVLLAGDNYWLYTFVGAVPEALKSHQKFKVMVLANWPNYPDRRGTDLKDRTVADVVEAEWAQFEAPDGLELNANRRSLIPMYGLKNCEIEDETFVDYKTYDLGDINLLRAVAKVEVQMPADVAFAEGGEPVIEGCNRKGWCAPTSDLRETDKDAWTIGAIWQTWPLHLIGGTNDAGAAGNRAKMVRTGDDNTWVAYVPEFKNTGGNESLSKIRMVLQGEKVTEFALHFAEYDKFGDPDPEKLYDIHRNYWYKFTVSRDERNMKVTAQVRPYDTVDLEPEFGQLPNNTQN